MQLRRLGPERAGAWVRAGWDLYRASPGPWTAMGAVCLVDLIAQQYGNGLITGLANLLWPALLGGLMVAAREQSAARTPAVACLFRPLREPHLLGPLLMLGALLAASSAFLGDTGEAALNGAVAAITGERAASLPGPALALLVLALTISVILTMALWFAIPLLIFDAQGIVGALRLSLRAWRVNPGALTLYSLFMLVLGLVALIPAGLGLLILLPLGGAAVYVSYGEIFAAEAEAAPP